MLAPDTIINIVGALASIAGLYLYVETRKKNAARWITVFFLCAGAFGLAGLVVSVASTTTTLPLNVRVGVAALLGAIIAGGLTWLLSGLPERPKAPLTESDARQMVGSLPATAHLMELGWTVKPEPDVTMFEVWSKPIPSMEESAKYFSQLNKPFKLHFQQVTGLGGLHLLASNPLCNTISVSAGEFGDISELKGFSNLTHLNISQLPLNSTDIVVETSPLASLVNLEELGLGMSRVRNIDFVRSLPKLTSLSIGQTLVTDISPLSGQPKLSTLDIRGTRVTDLSPLNSVPTLGELHIGGTQIPGLVNLKLNNLKSLYIIEQGQIDLSPVGSLTELEGLWIVGPPIIETSFLRKTKGLTSLSLMGVGFFANSIVTDPFAIADLAQLRSLTLSSLQIADLNIVSNLGKLTELNLNKLPVVSLAPLQSLHSLEKLTLTDISVGDIEPLLGLPHLAEVRVLRVPVRSDTIKALQRRGVDVIVN